MIYRCMLFTIIILGINGCTSKYHADWIVTKAEFEGANVSHLITLFNFNIDTKKNIARPCKISFTDKFTLSKAVPIKLSKKQGQDYIEIFNHADLTGKYKIQCLDKNCCTISIQNDKIYLEMVYNSEIPYGRIRKCD